MEAKDSAALELRELAESSNFLIGGARRNSFGGRGGGGGGGLVGLVWTASVFFSFAFGISVDECIFLVVSLHTGMHMGTR